jgi:hypothetical protein
MRPLLFIAGGLATLSHLHANPTIRDAASHEQLAAKLRQADQTDPMKQLVAKTEVPAVPVHQPESLMSRSDVISFGGIAALVPKRAILSLPAKFKDRIGTEGNPRLVSWAEFYAANKGWISIHEVTRPQASGKAPLGDAALAQIDKGTTLIIATFMGGPISVLPLQQTEEPANTPD